MEVPLEGTSSEDMLLVFDAVKHFLWYKDSFKVRDKGKGFLEPIIQQGYCWYLIKIGARPMYLPSVGWKFFCIALPTVFGTR